MKYALGNMLNGAGGLNPDGLALDLQFAADKTLTARRGPTPVLTRASTATFVGSNGLIQSAAINAARFDHDPVTLASRGLLIEENRTNLILQSENFNSASWVKGGGSISSVTNVEPDGSANSWLFTEDTLNSTHRTFQSFNGTSGTVYTLSVFLKFAGRQYVFLENRSITTNPYVVFDIQNGSVFSTIGALTPTIQAYPNGWYRCSVTGTANAAGGNYLIGGFSGGLQSYTGSGGPAFYAWGAQVEAGSFPTSYIPTTTASVVRSADVCSITGAAFTGMYNNPAGTLISEAMIANLTGGDRGILQIDNDGNVHYLRTVYDLNFKSMVRANDTATTLINTAGAASTTQKMGLSYEGTSFASCINGGAIVSATRTMPVGLVAMRIGSLFSGFYLSGHISAIRYYKKRLPNAKLQALTV